MFWFSLQLLPEAFFILRTDKVWNVYWSSCKVSVIFVMILMKLEFSLQIFEKYSNIKFHGNPPRWSQTIRYGKTEITKLIVIFCNFAKAPKNTRGHYSASKNNIKRKGRPVWNICMLKVTVSGTTLKAY